MESSSLVSLWSKYQRVDFLQQSLIVIIATSVTNNANLAMEQPAVAQLQCT